MKLNVIPSKDPWYADGLSFTCTCCGNCCTGGPGYVWMSDQEIDRLAEHLGLSRDETFKKYCRKLGQKVSLKEKRSPQGNYDCIFLEEIPVKKEQGKVTLARRVCAIYHVRPLQCRTWPFWDGNLASEKQWSEAAKRCPGMNTGRRYTKERIEALRDAPDWPDRPPTSSGESK